MTIINIWQQPKMRLAGQGYSWLNLALTLAELLIEFALSFTAFFALERVKQGHPYYLLLAIAALAGMIPQQSSGEVGRKWIKSNALTHTTSWQSL